MVAALGVVKALDPDNEVVLAELKESLATHYIQPQQRAVEVRGKRRASGVWQGRGRCDARKAGRFGSCVGFRVAFQRSLFGQNATLAPLGSSGLQ